MISGVKLFKNFVMVIDNFHNASCVDKFTKSFFTYRDNLLMPSVALGTTWNYATA